MPLQDEQGNAIGCVQVEQPKDGNYTRNFMIIDFSTHKLRLYPEEAEFATDLTQFKQTEINCQYITKVNSFSNRPKVLNCLEIVTPTISYIISVNSAEERDDWIDSIKKASMRQSSAAKTAQKAGSKDAQGYSTKVVGGVVQRVPITATNGQKCEIEGAAECQEEESARSRHRGFPRILKAGHGIKLGAVMKNWKRRFFVLSEVSLGYYKTLDEIEPIKSVSVGEITSVAPSKEIPGKEHLFEVVTPNRTFYVQAENKEDLEDWVRVFNDLLQVLKPSLQQHGQVNNLESGADGGQVTLV